MSAAFISQLYNSEVGFPMFYYVRRDRVPLILLCSATLEVG
jgi:hypothetical protein